MGNSNSSLDDDVQKEKETKFNFQIHSDIHLEMFKVFQNLPDIQVKSPILWYHYYLKNIVC
jgi:hypothetical protein